MAGEDIVRGGLGTQYKVRTIGGGQATITAIATAQLAIVAAQADKAQQEITKQVVQNQKAVIEARQAVISSEIDSWQAIIDDPESTPEAEDEATSQIADLETEETENDTSITNLEAEITALDADIAAAQTIIDDETTNIETLESVANAGVFTLIPNVEDAEVPMIKHKMDSFVPIDGATGGYPVTKPTGVKENSDFKLPVVLNGFDTIHQQMRNAAENATRQEMQIVFTDGMACQFYFYCDFKPIVKADKLNRAEFGITVDGRITWN